MKIRALTSFCGSLCMAKDEIRECSDKAVLADLLSAGYIEAVRAEPAQRKTASKRSMRENEGQ